MRFRFFRKRDKTHYALARTRSGWGGGIRSLFQGNTLPEAFLWEQLEDALISADVGVNTSLSLITSVRHRVREEGIQGLDALVELFKEEMAILLEPKDPTVWDWYDQEDIRVKPFVLLVIGVNGAGKTTSIAKIAKHYADLGMKVMLGAGDTFRAAAVEQLKIWGGRLGVDIVAHQQGSDPGAVAYDAYQAAVARGSDILIFDTAGRLQNKVSLVEELKKINRVFGRSEPTAPHQTMLVIDATTGHNGVEQARVFQEAVGVSGVFLAKLDGTAKGGIVVAIAQELGLPVIFVGTGEELADLSLFDTDDFVNALFEDKQPA